MALVKTLPDPFEVGADLEGCYLRWGDLVISPRTKTVRVVFEVYRSEAARNAGKAPLPIPVEFTIGPVGAPAQYGPVPVDAEGNPTGEPAPLLSPAVPSYDDWRAAINATVDGQPGAADLIGALVYGYAKAQPELTDAVDA
jgi:hypothetical protein